MNLKTDIDNRSIRLFIKEYLKERSGCPERKSAGKVHNIQKQQITRTGISEINSI